MPACPICNTASDVVRTLDKPTITEGLRKLFDAAPPQDLGSDAYELARCRACTLEFAVPMTPGSSAFYDWITQQPAYFPPDRWEWDVVINEVAKLPSGGLLVEVGCGSGLFLERLKRRAAVRGVGLDITQGVVDGCRGRGLEAYCEYVERYGDALRPALGLADVAVAFHCLEHVSDPVGFVRSMADMLKSGGRILVSTPYSPMSFENLWLDPLNHPPHHMTRWNARAYRALANRLGLGVRFLMPAAGSIASRMSQAIYMWAAVRGRRPGKVGRMATAATHPVMSTRELLRQVRRERVDGRVAADVVLVELMRPA
jgi:SAM-dependent methyltransferase